MNPGSRNTTPAIVRAAELRCRELGFQKSCLPETGQLLGTLAATVTRGRILELGTGCGYSTAWLASGLMERHGTELITIDSEPRLARATRETFADWPKISVRCGDWRTPLDDGPYQLIFVDVSEAKTAGTNAVIDALAPGGIVLLDDLTPVELWPDEWRGWSDPVRDAWFHHSRLASTEVRVTAGHAVILGAKR